MPTILNEDPAYEWMFGNLSEERITELATTQLFWKDILAQRVDKKFRESIVSTKMFSYGHEVPSLVKHLELL